MASVNSGQGWNNFPPEELKQTLDEFSLDTWNFVVYRCSYGDEKLWTEFKDIWIREVHNQIAESDAPELAQSMAWTFFDDERTFKDVSMDGLRRHFKKWTVLAPAVEQPRAQTRHRREYSPRYRWFIHVDHEAMQSVLENPRALHVPHYEEGHVNLVDSKYGLELERMLNEHVENEENGEVSELEMHCRSLDNSYPPIDGCTAQEVGWMKMQYSRVAPETYNLLTFDDDSWYNLYVRPPEKLPY